MTADQVHVVLYLASAAVGLVVAGLVGRGSRPWSPHRHLASALAWCSAWALGALGILLVPAARTTVLVVVVLPVVALSVGAFFALLSTVADRSWRPGATTRRLLVGHPTVMLLLGATNDLHHLVLTSPVGGDGLRFGPVFWLHSLVAYGLVGVGFTRAVRARRRAPALRNAQLTAVLVAGCVPGLTVAGEIAYMVLNEVVVHDLTPVAFLVAGLIDVGAVLRGGALKVLPIARAHVLDRLSDLVVVLDESGEVLDLNLAARDLLTGAGAAPGGPGGTPAELGALGEVARAGSGEHVLETPRGPRTFDVRVTPLTDAAQRLLGTVVVARDMTADVERRTELARANAALREHVRLVERLRAEVAEQAIRDAGTGLHNRRHLDGVLAGLCDDLDAAGAPVSVVMLDADHFKQVNDEHGHAVGDRLLTEIAHAMTAAVRAGDTVARYGGEEFVVLLPGTGHQEARRRAEDLRVRCSRVQVTAPGGVRVGVTTSAGVATSGPGRATPDALLEAADAALYRAKREGRARTCAAPHAPVGPDGRGLPAGPVAAGADAGPEERADGAVPA